MNKIIKEGETLTITGQYIYSGVDTSVYWNSVSEESQAEVLPDSFTAQDTQIQVNVPCCLPEHNKVVLYNGVNYFTGEQVYQFVGAPEIDEFSPYAQLWEGDVLVKGKYFTETTGLFIGGLQIVDYDWPSSKRLVFEMPNDFLSGHIEIYTDVGNVKSTGVLYGIAPPIYGNLVLENSVPRYYGDSALIVGKSMHKVNKVILSGINEEISLTEGSLSKARSTGLSFDIPIGTLNDSTITLQHQSGSYQNGEFVSNVYEEFVVPTLLNVNSSYITKINKNNGIYNSPIIISGINLDKSKILFLGHNNNYIEAEPISSGTYHHVVNTPKNIRGGNVVVSGYVDGYTGIGISREFFYPLPSIKSINTTGWRAGASIEIEAINASEIYPAIGITGVNLIDGTQGNYFVTNPSDWLENQNYFGFTLPIHSGISQDSETGYTKILAMPNTSFAGEGYPFLISAHQANNAQTSSALFAALKNSETYNNINSLTGQRVLISGKEPKVLGLSSYRVENSGLLIVSGTHFFGATGLRLFSASETKAISRSQFVNGIQISSILEDPTLGSIAINLLSLYQSETRIAEIKTGEGNRYEQVHAVVADLKDFNFTSKSGKFAIVTPYHA